MTERTRRVWSKGGAELCRSTPWNIAREVSELRSKIGIGYDDATFWLDVTFLAIDASRSISSNFDRAGRKWSSTLRKSGELEDCPKVAVGYGELTRLPQWANLRFI
ncbi:hypothetical protein KM043_008889 [Ampulex compressa]|nr:hypothetical protein KM043_008889 [Ampulex compressa]